MIFRWKLFLAYIFVLTLPFLIVPPVDGKMAARGLLEPHSDSTRTTGPALGSSTGPCRSSSRWTGEPGQPECSPSSNDHRWKRASVSGFLFFPTPAGRHGESSESGGDRGGCRERSRQQPAVQHQRGGRVALCCAAVSRWWRISSSRDSLDRCPGSGCRSEVSASLSIFGIGGRVGLIFSLWISARLDRRIGRLD